MCSDAMTEFTDMTKIAVVLFIQFERARFDKLFNAV
jgi:hypothetical protein